MEPAANGSPPVRAGGVKRAYRGKCLACGDEWPETVKQAVYDRLSDPDFDYDHEEW